MTSLNRQQPPASPERSNPYKPSPELRTVVLLTGASSGIGAATARELSGRGYALVLAARRLERLNDLRAELDPAGRYILTVLADVTLNADRRRLVEAALERFGRVDVLVNNAGLSIPSGAWWDAPDPLRVLEVNLTAPIELTRLVLPAMRARRAGQVVNIGSVAGQVATQGMYSASKFGLRGFSLSLRRELLGSGVEVSLVSPGFVRTELTRQARLPMPGGGRAGRRGGAGAAPARADRAGLVPGAAAPGTLVPRPRRCGCPPGDGSALPQSR